MPHDQAAHSHTVLEQLRELMGSQTGQLQIEGQGDHHIHAGALQERQPVSDGCDEFDAGIRDQDGPGMVDKGQDAAEHSSLGGSFLEPVQKVLVAHVHPVEDTYGQDGILLG